MLDDRLDIWRRAGYSEPEVQMFLERFPVEFATKAGRVESVNEARALLRETLAEQKASLEE